MGIAAAALRFTILSFHRPNSLPHKNCKSYQQDAFAASLERTTLFCSLIYLGLSFELE